MIARPRSTSAGRNRDPIIQQPMRAIILSQRPGDLSLRPQLAQLCAVHALRGAAQSYSKDVPCGPTVGKLETDVSQT
jgi:hypothetical protein